MRVPVGDHLLRHLSISTANHQHQTVSVDFWRELLHKCRFDLLPVSIPVKEALGLGKTVVPEILLGIQVACKYFGFWILARRVLVVHNFDKSLLRYFGLYHLFNNNKYEGPSE